MTARGDVPRYIPMGRSSEGRSDTLGETWRAFLETLDANTRDFAQGVPAEIGLQTGDDEISWDRFVQLAPNRALPRYAIPDTHAVDADCVARFVRAHHHAAFFGIVADRIADAQVRSTPDLEALRTLLLRAWESRLSEAIGDRVAARAIIAEDLWAWREGLRGERAAFASRTLRPDRYFATVSVRLRWISTTARAMLRARGLSFHAAHLRRCYDLFLFACQCRDDAVDADEDRQNRGVSVADMLGLTPGALLRTAVTYVSRAKAHASAAGLGALATWFEGYGPEVDVWWPGEAPIVQTLGAMVLAEAEG